MKKKLSVLSVVLFLAILSYAFVYTAGGMIKGKIVPGDGASQVWAMSSHDTLKAAISQGTFQITNVKQGTYKIYIDAIKPYKDVVKESVQVTEDGTLDLGEIQLTK